MLDGEISLATHVALQLVRHNNPKGPDLSPAEAKLPLSRHFRRNEHVSMRTSWSDRNATWVAMKGRVPWAVASDPGHPHDDLGGFVLETCGERWASDLGAEGYDEPQYFDLQLQRWAYYRAAWAGHNVLTLRQHAPSAAAPLPSAGLMKNLSASAAFFGVKLEETGDGVASLNLTDVHNGHAEVTRKLRLQGHVVTITDAVTPNVDAEAVWTMHTCTTWCGLPAHAGHQPWLAPSTNRTIDVDGSTAVIRSSNGTSVTLHIHATGGSAGALSWAVESAKPPASPAGQKQNEDYSKLVAKFRVHAGVALNVSVRIEGSCARGENDGGQAQRNVAA